MATEGVAAARLNSRLCRCSTEVDALEMVYRNPLGLNICSIPSVMLLWLDRRECMAVVAEASWLLLPLLLLHPIKAAWPAVRGAELEVAEAELSREKI